MGMMDGLPDTHPVTFGWVPLGGNTFKVYGTTLVNGAAQVVFEAEITTFVGPDVLRLFGEKAQEVMALVTGSRIAPPPPNFRPN